MIGLSPFVSVSDYGLFFASDFIAQKSPGLIVQGT
jgi:hypothetical protein